MANNSVLKAAIADVVKQNGTNAITGNLLQQSLLSMIDALGGNYQYAGIATPTTNPGTPDQKVFYLAATAGTYPNFGNIVLADGDVAVISGSGANWTKNISGVASLESVRPLIQEIDGYDKKEYSGWADSSGNIISSPLAYYRVFQVNGGETIFLGGLSYIMILSDFSYNPSLPYVPTYATGESGRRVGTNMTYTLPNNARYLIINSVNNSGEDVFPTSIVVDGVDCTKTLKDWKLLCEDNKAEIDKIDDTFSTFVPIFEQGGINSAGVLVNRNDRIRTVNFISIEKFISIYTNKNNYKVYAIFYDVNRDFVGTSTNFVAKIKIEDIPSNVYYLKFLVSKGQDENITPTDEHGFEIMYNLNTYKSILLEENSKRMDLIPFCKTSNYYIDSAGQKIYSPSWLLYEIDTTGIESVFCTLFNSLPVADYPYLAVAFYDEDGNYISGKNFSVVSPGVRTLIDNFPINAATIAFANRISDGSAILECSSLEESFSVLQKEIKDNANAINEIDETLRENYDSVGNAEFWLGNVSTHSDITWVGENLVGFDSQDGDNQDPTQEDAQRIYIYSFPNGIKSDAQIKVLWHKFGHCNTVDYCKETDCLILGNGSGSYTLTGDIIIIPNFSTLISATAGTVFTLESANALVIHCSSELGTKFNLMWGDDNDKNYNLAYLITANYGGSGSTGGDLSKIRKILLRKGEEIGEYGVVIENSTPFNGTFDIVETYVQETAGYPNCEQGGCYHNGRIFASIGHDGLWIWEMRLSNSHIYRKNRKQVTFYSNKPLNFGNSTGVAYKDGYLFIGRSNLGCMAIHCDF